MLALSLFPVLFSAGNSATASEGRVSEQSCLSVPRDAVIDAQISGGVEAPANILGGKEAQEPRPAVQSALLL